VLSLAYRRPRSRSPGSVRIFSLSVSSAAIAAQFGPCFSQSFIRGIQRLQGDDVSHVVHVEVSSDTGKILYSMTKYRILTLAAVILAAASLTAQQQDSAECDTKSDTKSLGEVASMKPSGSTTAKVRIDDDSLDSVIAKVKQPIPDITLDGLDNSDEIVTAINDYKAHHSPEETEAMLKDWWDRHETALVRFADENKALSERLQDQRYYYRDQTNSDDYRKVQQQYLDQQKSAQMDQRSMMENGMRIGRIQQTFTKVRTGISVRCHLQYDWFKVPNGNGIGSF
jgi:hypothetical protein